MPYTKLRMKELKKYGLDMTWMFGKVTVSCQRLANATRQWKLYDKGAEDDTRDCRKRSMLGSEVATCQQK